MTKRQYNCGKNNCVKISKLKLNEKHDYKNIEIVYTSVI
jgi:hypothetical protein